ncbi:hypothetical protein [Streptomyces sp. GESEQ-4]|uniref:hypothetical protein n=1 Tax=Streptomyces sp. GESEQ-4 TaxID=2812655 RepID=UPI001B3304EA|nr:hypothetical protein [Streptomyces sp. GESEQ-4]
MRDRHDSPARPARTPPGAARAASTRAAPALPGRCVTLCRAAAAAGCGARGRDPAGAPPPGTAVMSL